MSGDGAYILIVPKEILIYSYRKNGASKRNSKEYMSKYTIDIFKEEQGEDKKDMMSEK